MIRATLTALVLTLATTTLATAQDGGLYEDVPDPDAAFLRVIGADLTAATVNGTTLEGLETGISPYVVITDAGDITVDAGAESSTVTVTPATFHSLLVAADGTRTLVSDPLTLSPAQADVTFYNLSDRPSVDLYAPAAKATAIPAVPPNTGGSVALKAPLTLDFEAREGDTVLATISGVVLERRGGVALVLRGTGGSYDLLTAPNAIAK